MTSQTSIKSAEYEYQYQDSTLTHTYLYLTKPLLSMISEQAKFGEGNLRVLDLGCGNGSLSNIIARQGYQVVGVEESASGIAIAQPKFPDCQFIQASIYDAPKAELLNAFDVVIAVEVIEHLFYPKELVTLARKCLKPTGKLIITTPYHGYFKNLLLALSGKMDNHFSVLWDGGHIKFFSVDTLTKLLETEGYTDINFKFAGRLPYLWKSMLCSASVAR